MARNCIHLLKLSLAQRFSYFYHIYFELIIPSVTIILLFILKRNSSYSFETKTMNDNVDYNYYDGNASNFDYRSLYKKFFFFNNISENEIMCSNKLPHNFEFTYGYYLLGSCIQMNNNIIAFIGRDLYNNEIYDSIQSKINETLYSMYYQRDQINESFRLLFIDYSNYLEFENDISSEKYQKKRLNQSHVSSGICAGIEIKNTTESYNVTLRFEDNYYIENYFNFSNISAIPSTFLPSYRKNNLNYYKDIDSFAKYTGRGFFHLQNLIAYQILKNETGSQDPIIVNSIDHIEDTFERDVFIKRVINFIPITLLIGFFLCYHRFCFKLFNERNDNFILKIREFNVSLCAYWTSILLESISFFIIFSIILSFSMISLFHYINYWLFFLFFVTYYFSLSAFGLLLSSLIDSGKILSLLSSSIYFMLHVIGFLLNYLNYSSSIKLGLSFLPPIFGISILN